MNERISPQPSMSDCSTQSGNPHTLDTTAQWYTKSNIFDLWAPKLEKAIARLNQCKVNILFAGQLLNSAQELNSIEIWTHMLHENVYGNCILIQRHVGFISCQTHKPSPYV